MLWTELLPSRHLWPQKQTCSELLTCFEAYHFLYEVQTENCISYSRKSHLQLFKEKRWKVILYQLLQSFSLFLEKLPGNARRNESKFQVDLTPRKENWNGIWCNATVQAQFSLLFTAATVTALLVCDLTTNVLPLKRLGCNTFWVITITTLLFIFRPWEGKIVVQKL